MIKSSIELFLSKSKSEDVNALIFENLVLIFLENEVDPSGLMNDKISCFFLSSDTKSVKYTSTLESINVKTLFIESFSFRKSPKLTLFLFLVNPFINLLADDNSAVNLPVGFIGLINSGTFFNVVLMVCIYFLEGNLIESRYL